MKILVYGINYSPELTGIGKYTGEMCSWLSAKGHQVEVITGMPYYPKWKIDEKYLHKRWHTEIIEGVKVRRTPLYVPQRVTGFARIRHELSFVINSLVFWIAAFFRKYDVVVGVCPPLQTGIYPMIYKILHRKPFIYHMQDLQLDTAKELGMLKNKFLINFLQFFEKLILRNATLITSLSQGMKTKILSKGIDESKFKFLPNWTDIDFIKPLSKELSLRSELGFKNTDKIVLYSGNLGEKQGLELVLNVAKKLPDISFVFCGEGASKLKLMDLALELKNVFIYGLQPYEKMSQLLAIADLHLIVQRKAASDLVMPSKLLNVLAAGGLAIVTASPETSLYEIIESNSIGILVEPDNEEALLKAIIMNIDKGSSCCKIKANARKYAEQNLNIDLVLTDFEEILYKLQS